MESVAVGRPFGYKNPSDITSLVESGGPCRLINTRLLQNLLEAVEVVK